MNTLIKMFSLCLCFCALVFASPDTKLNDDKVKLEPISVIGDIDAPIVSIKPTTHNPSGDTRDCDACEFDFTNYGSECCDSAWDEYGISCEDLEANYSWDCSGCECPGDGPAECGDGNCTGDEDYYSCPEDCNAPGECDDGFVVDCVDDDCCPESWIGDGFEDCADQAYGCDLTCYDNDGGDCVNCEENGQITCDDGSCADTLADCPEPSGDCADCEFDFTNYGSECCDTAWDEYGINCADLEANYSWDCSGCNCPGDGDPECGDGSCNGDEDYYSCPEDCNAPGECDDGLVPDCDGSGECWPESWIGDGFEDCADQAYGADLCCYDGDGGDCPESACSNCEDDGLVTCWDGSCAASADDCPDQPAVETPGICAEGLGFDPYGGTAYQPAVAITWSIETVCGDGVCNGDEDYYNCPEDCSAPGECDDGYAPDCVDDDCGPESWIGDGLCDGDSQEWGINNCCYDLDGGDCTEAECDGSGGDGGGDDGGSGNCEDCEFDFTNYGSECCDTAWDEYGINCADLEANYSWDCSGCNCPGDGPSECGDGNCTGDEDYYSCPEDCNAPGECDDGFVVDCVDDDCCPESWIGDGFEDCEDQAYGCDLTCYDNDGGDCGGRDALTGSRSIINNNVEIIKKGAPYSRAVASAPFHGEYTGPSSRDLVINLTFECISGYNAGFVNTWPADPSFGEFTVYGWGADDFICVTAQACDGPACGDSTEPVCVLAGADDGVQECTEGSGGDPCDGTVAGDANLDGGVDVLDIVQMVNHILESALLTDECALGAADFTGDGSVDVLDIVQVVNIILEGRTTGDASSATLNNVDGHVTIEADGYIGGVQMTLSHGPDFSINVTDKALVADYNTMGNTTKLVIVAPESDELFTASGDFTIDEMIVANSNSQVDVIMPTALTLSKAYPNPFNPSTSLEIYVPAEGFVSLNVYNVMGQLVDVIHSGSMSEGYHSITWNASSMTSGVYFVRAESANGMSVQKVMLMK